MKGCNKAIIVGDHSQLRPTVGQNALVAGLDGSLFEWLYTRGDAEPLRGTKHCILDLQDRMHSSLCTFSSGNLYVGKLRTGARDEGRALPASMFPRPTNSGGTRIVFVQCSAAEDLGQRSKSNAGQVTVCKDIYQRLNYALHAPAPRIAKRRPYRFIVQY